MKISILLAGVGGQGVITAANILANAALKDGYNVITSELHGMAQRGGDVKCAVRIGDVYSPIIPPGTAKAIVSMEPLEALRNLEVVARDGIVITDINPIYPPLTSIGIGKYPSLEEIFKKIEEHCKLIKIDGNALARKAGNVVTQNVVMLGALHSLKILPIRRESIIETIKEALHKHAEINIKAFELGEKAIP